MAVKAPADPRIGYPVLSYPAGSVKGLTLSQLASDTFNRANAGSLGAGWSSGSDVGLSIVSNEAAGAASGAAADLRTETYGPDQYSKLTVGSAHTVSGGYVAATTRSDPTGQNQYAALYLVSGPSLAIYKRTAGTYTAITTTMAVPAFNTGDTLQLVSEGAQHTASINGQAYLTVTDSAIVGGAPGIATFNAMTVDAFQGGNAHTIALSAATQSDVFARANAGMSVGQPHWSPMTFNDGSSGMVDCPIVSSELNTGAAATGHNGDYRTTEAWPADHWSQLVVGSVPPVAGSGAFVGLTSRVQPAGNAGYFACIFTLSSNTPGFPQTGPTVSYRLYRLDHGTPDTSTLLAAAAQANQGTLDPTATAYTLVSQGSRQSFRVAGKEILAATDSTYPAGVPGVLLFPPTATADSWTAGPV